MKERETRLERFRCRGLMTGELYLSIASFCVLLLAPVISAMIAPATVALAQPPGYSQYDVEATYVYNFARFVRWPQGTPGMPLAICVLGENPFGDTLQHLVGHESIGGRPLAARMVSSVQEARSCSILFLSGHDEAERDRDISILRKSPVLTVSDSPAFLDAGGVIQFIVLDGRVRFSVNLDAANEDGLEISSQLLKVAVNVIGKPLPGAPK